MPPSLRPGLYESLVTEELERELREVSPDQRPRTRGLNPAEAGDRLSWHLGKLLRGLLDDLPEATRLEEGLEIVREVLAVLAGSSSRGDLRHQAPQDPATLLAAIERLGVTGKPVPLPSPATPLLDTTLLTNAPDEPRIGKQIESELPSADRVDLAMAFIRRSGLRPLLPALRRLREAARPLRVLTTTYTGSTERSALDLLVELGAEVRISYDTSATRLHAKAWHFHRDSGFSTVFIGSSNLTYSAQVTGLEWNVRVSQARNPDLVRKVAAVFESYWHSGDFLPYVPEQFDQELDRERRPADAPRILLSPLELRLEPFQERLLEQLLLSRSRGHHRNLLVAATGTGKTVMAAVDYRRLREDLGRARLLFVAHRREILDQSLATFRQALRDPYFGELWVAGERPTRGDHVFASIQSLRADRVRDLDPGHFDVVVVDEFHHAAAPSYEALLSHLQPRELLGLTATPERSDGLPLLHHFGERIAAELRLWDAIDQGRLVPFQYFGIHDATDLTRVPWRRGRGYDVEALTDVLTADDLWARRVLGEFLDRSDDPERARTLGFCVSVAHARFMARFFRSQGLEARAIWAETPAPERAQALRDLDTGSLQVLFAVDLFNEGVDLPRVDTLLLLRPTDSPVLFLQQLGRGLRRSRGKTTCTVLDFVGQHRREFRHDRRFRALLGGSRKDLQDQIEAGFPYLPAGCHLELEPLAQESVLRNLRESIPTRWTAKAEELRSLAAQRGAVRLASFLEETGMELGDVYTGNRSWSDLRQAAGLPVEPPGPAEVKLRRACGRLLHVDDPERIGMYRRLLEGPPPPGGPPAAEEVGSLAVENLGERERRLARMLVSSVAGTALGRQSTLGAGLDLLRSHRQVVAELLELFEVLEQQGDHLQHPLTSHPEVPLAIHARYTRAEILAAFGTGGSGARVSAWQTGVYRVEDARSDLLAFTLDKTAGSFSPTTRYRDYAISRELVHWESQNACHSGTEAGRRYQEHASRGDHIQLFARRDTTGKDFWFLGPATYVRHRGERPMAITWRLEVPLPGDLFQQFAAAVA